MAIIDQRILIPARQEVVWAYLSDLSKNADWQADCTSVSFLSTKHDGVGARWRVSSDKSKDAVYEITTWYNGLGYEYVIVDGAAYKDNKGRLRLQEIPEGTVVQWTFSFEGGGFLGGGKVRQLDATMAASLKALYKQIKTLNQNEGLVARSLMRDAPDVEARAAYKPRHAASLSDGTPATVTEDAVLLPATPEPEVAAGDAAFVAAVVVDLSSEPPVAVDDTRPRPPLDAEPDENARFAPPPPTEEPATAAEVVSLPEPAPPEPDVTPEPPEAEAPVAPVATPEPSAAAEPGPDRTAAAAAAAAASQLPPSDPTGKSIWEIFGVQRPGEPSPAPVEATAQPEAESEPQPADTEALSKPDPQETIPLEVVAMPTAVVIPPVVVDEPPTGTAADVGLLAEEVVPSAAVLIAAPTALTVRRGLRMTERRGLVKLRRPN